MEKLRTDRFPLGAHRLKPKENRKKTGVGREGKENFSKTNSYTKTATEHAWIQIDRQVWILEVDRLKHESTELSLRTQVCYTTMKDFDAIP